MSKKVLSLSSEFAMVVPQLAECLSDRVGLKSLCGGGGMLCLGELLGLGGRPRPSPDGCEIVWGCMKYCGRRCLLSANVTVGTASGAASND